MRQALAAGGRLVTSAAEAHAVEDLGGLAGHRVFASIAAANTGVADAISSVAGGHRQLETLGRKLGYDVRAYGDGKKPPEEEVRRFFTGADGSDRDAIG